MVSGLSKGRREIETVEHWCSCILKRRLGSHGGMSNWRQLQCNQQPWESPTMGGPDSN